MTETMTSQLERVLRSGTFAVTTELSPPDSVDLFRVCGVRRR